MQEGNIDVAFRSLSATDIADLRGNDKVKVVDGPGGEIRYIVFNFDTHAVRRQDRRGRPGQGARRPPGRRRPGRPRARSPTQVYKGTYTPLYSYVPAGLTGATEVAQGPLRRRQRRPGRRQGQGGPRRRRRHRPRSR